MRYFVFFIAILIFVSCGNKEEFTTDPNDYNAYLDVPPNAPTSKYFELWNSKIGTDSTQLMSFSHVAGEYNRFFKNTGNITYLKMAEQALNKAVAIANINKATYYRSLARNYIAQHRFREALQMANSALEHGDGLKATQALLFDVHMELGNYKDAQKQLDNIRNISDFGYLIRVAKWSDHRGDLTNTIKFMEKALAKAETSNNKDLLLWSYTNLADYYGHDGQIAASYNHYLKALALDPQNAYAKKGIAWIVFSHEKNGAEALRILEAVTKNNGSPDYYLLIAQIADFMGHESCHKTNIDRFFKVLGNPDYGAMYRTHMVDFYLEEQQYQSALQVAFAEIHERPTPETYNVLAHVYLARGEEEKALHIAEQHIIGKTFEPSVLLNVAKIYKANQVFEKVAVLKKELVGAAYELGPSSINEIKSL